MLPAQRNDCFHCSTCVCSPVFDHLLSTLPALSHITPQEFATQLQELQIRVASLRSHVAEASRRHNSMIPVNRLPPEILGEIFLYTRDTARDQGWTAVSQTHHTWRAVALSQRRLWSVLDLAFPEWTFGEMINRAKGVPLTLTHSVGQWRQSSLDQKLAVWDTLDVTHGAMFTFTANLELSFFTAIFPRISAAAANVQAIRLSTMSRHGLNLPPDVLDGYYPRLTTLRLGQQRSPAWGSSLYGASNLRHLYITGASGSSPSHTLEPVVATLRLLPRLEKLKLHRCLPWKAVRESPIPAASEKLTLPRLAMLDLKGRPQSCARLCQHLQIPPTCRTRIYCTAPCAGGELQSLIKLTLASPARLHAARLRAGCLEEEDDVVKIFASMDYTSEGAFRYLRVPGAWEWGGSSSRDDDIMQAITDVESDALSLIPVAVECDTCPWIEFGGASRAKVIHIDWTLDGGYASSAELAFGECFPRMETLILEGLCVRSMDFVALSESLATHERVRRVQLAGCTIVDEGLDGLRMALPRIEIEVVDGGIEGRWVRRIVQS